MLFNDFTNNYRTLEDLLTPSQQSWLVDDQRTQHEGPGLARYSCPVDETAVAMATDTEPQIKLDANESEQRRVERVKKKIYPGIIEID